MLLTRSLAAGPSREGRRPYGAVPAQSSETSSRLTAYSCLFILGLLRLIAYFNWRWVSRVCLLGLLVVLEVP